MEKPQTSVLQASALELQERLTDGSLTTLALTTLFLDQIDRHNRRGLRLNAVVSVAPREKLLARAKSLDQERSTGTIRSKLHGVPVIVKDAIVTHASLGMPTTVGSHVFAMLKAKRNAALVDKLLDAGLIILGKANTTEFCGLKSNEPPGWSSYMGQTLSPYRRPDLSDDEQAVSWPHPPQFLQVLLTYGHVPGGSSSGSAVSVAAGLCPLAIGTETAGSVVFPASCNGLYGMKLTPGSVPGDGIFQLSESFDGVGVMARDPADVAAFAEILQTGDGGEHNMPESLVDREIPPAKSTPMVGLSIGVVSNTWGLYEKKKWASPDVVTSYGNAVQLLKTSGARVVYPLDAPEHVVLQHKDETLTTVSYHEFPSQVQRFITNFEEDSQVNTLADVITWNQEHADIALPEPYSSQSELIKALNSTMTEELRHETVEALRTLAGPQGMGKVMRERGIDIILAPSDSTLVSFAACAGWPIATVPLSRLERNGQPYGFFPIAKDGREDLLFRFMAAYHQVFPVVEKPSAPFV